MARSLRRKRNIYARELAEQKYKQKVVRSKKHYKRFKLPKDIDYED